MEDWFYDLPLEAQWQMEEEYYGASDEDENE